MRQAEVQSLFLQSFTELFPQFKFRGIRRFRDRSREPFAFSLRIAFGKNDTELDLLCATMTDGYPQNIKRFLRYISRAEPISEGITAVPVLVAPFFSQEAIDLLQDIGIGFIDLAGNAVLATSSLYLDIRGRNNRHMRRREVKSPFQGKSEYIARTLLMNPKEPWSMRKLAEASGVSLGLASMASSALVQTGAVTKNRTGLQVTDPGKLLDAWLDDYDLRRSPFQLYRASWSREEVERRLQREPHKLKGQYALTLWSGASHWLKEEPTAPHIAVYFSGPLEQIVSALGLDRNVGATLVFVFQAYDESVYWGAEDEAGHPRVVHPIQLCLDLGSGDEQEVALAQRIRERLF